MVNIRRNRTCVCTIFALILIAPMMIFWWNDQEMITLKTGAATMDISFLLDTNFATILGPTKSTFQWKNAFSENAEGPPHATEQKQLTVEAPNGPARHVAPNDMAILKRKFDTGNVWNEDTSSKNLIARLQLVRKNYLKINKYNVTFPETNKRVKHNAGELLCKLKNVNMEMIKRSDFPASYSNWTMHLPTNALSAVFGNFKQCAIVSSAGAMKSSGLGPEIDGHDAVLRFNAAPTKEFQHDVGMKTTIRLINSQVVTTQGHHFLSDPLYQSGILIMWDPAPYHAELHEWYQRPEYNFSENYQIYRMKNPTQPFYILNPNVIWKLWDIIQGNTLEDIQPNPPSSGMLGIVLMMNLCEEVDVYEYLPSRRKTDMCHYYEKFHDRACTLGAFHPLIFEKNLIKQINQGTDENIYFYGKVTLPGFTKVHC